jgi:hypothetical protein
MLDDVYIVGGSIHTLKKNNEALVITSIETGLEVNSEKTKDKVMSKDQHAGKNHNIKISKKKNINMFYLR